MANQQYAFVKSPCNVTVVFDGKSTVLVSVPEKYASKMTGICGDCNGNKKDDFKTKNGEDVSDKPNKYSLIGDSYVVTDDSDLEKIRYGISMLLYIIVLI